MPGLMLGLLLFLLIRPVFGEGAPVFFSEKGPGSMHAAVGLSLGAGLLIGFLAQRTRFCTMGAIRDVILMRDFHLISGVAAMLVVAFGMNLILGQVKFGFAGQPIAHSDGLVNFTGMLLAGLAYVLAGGCPGRQLFLAGEGDGDAGVFVLGMITGAAFAHNFNLAAKPDAIADGVVTVGGVSPVGLAAVILGIVICLAVGYGMREKAEARAVPSQKLAQGD
jgi:hypothetical protein